MQHLHGHRGVVAAAAPSPLVPHRSRVSNLLGVLQRNPPSPAIPMAGNLQARGHEPQTLKPASCWGHRLGNELWSRLEPLGAQPALPHPTWGHHKGWGAQPHRAAWGLQGHFIIYCRSSELVPAPRECAEKRGVRAAPHQRRTQPRAGSAPCLSKSPTPAASRCTCPCIPRGRFLRCVLMCQGLQHCPRWEPKAAGLFGAGGWWEEPRPLSRALAKAAAQPRWLSAGWRECTAGQGGLELCPPPPEGFIPLCVL